MAKKLDTVQERVARTATGGPGREPELPAEPGTVVMRDESDEIIDHLKRQLAALQTELSQYTTEDTEGSEGAAPSGGPCFSCRMRRLPPTLRRVSLRPGILQRRCLARRPKRIGSGHASG